MRHVRVAHEEQRRSQTREVLTRRLLAVDVAEGGGVNDVAVRARGLVEGDSQRPLLEVAQLAMRKLLALAQDGLARQIVEVVHPQPPQDGLVVVSSEDAARAGAEPLQRLDGLRPIAERVAQGDDAVNVLAVDVREDAFQSVDVRVNVRKNGVSHCHSHYTENKRKKSSAVEWGGAASRRAE